MARRSLGILLISTLALSGSAVVAASAGAGLRSSSAGTPIPVPEILNGQEQLPDLQDQMNGLVPLSQGQPHGHPLERVRGSQPQDMNEGALNLSSNWSGLIDTGSGVTFTSVQGDWVVPTVQASSSDEVSGTWIGIDGDGVSSLIQAGTAQNSGPDFGGAQYYAWVELLPGAPEIISGTSGPAPVQPGDSMAASIFEDSPGRWTINLNDATRDWSFSEPFSYSTPGATAEWIEEAPTINGNVARLSDYGSVTFTNLGVGGTGLSSAAMEPIYMYGGSGTVISYPTDFSASGNSFSLLYGSPNSPASSSSPSIPAPVTLPSTSSHGYWLVGSDGGIFAFGSAPFFGSAGSLHLQRPVVAIVTTPDRDGYWLGASDGGIFAFGDAGFYGSIPGLGLNPAGSGLPNSLSAPIVGMAPSADGHGYLMVASDGGIFAFGDARFAGSCPGIGGCSGAIVAVMPDASGDGYWVVTQTGHVYAFGDASYYGAPGPQNVAVTSAVRTPDGRGYWILFGNGTIASYGDAVYDASPIDLVHDPDATAIFSTSDGGGYWVAAANGAVANYGDAPNDGSMVGIELNAPIIGATGW